jgi:hypothetical protein
LIDKIVRKGARPMLAAATPPHLVALVRAGAT